MNQPREVVADALPEEYADALDALWAAHRCKNDDPIYRRFLAFLPRLHALATTPAASEGVEERAVDDTARLDWLSRSSNLQNEIVQHGYGSLRHRIDAALAAPRAGDTAQDSGQG